MHQRALIRHAVVAALKDRTAAEERVVGTRVWPWKAKDLPAIAVYTLAESVAPASRETAPRELERTVDVAIEAVVQMADDVDDVLDALALEIERAIHADETFGGAASDALLQSSELSVSPEGEQPVGLLRLVYDVRYFTYAPEAEDVGVDDLKTVDARYADLDGGDDIHPGDQAEDRLEHLDT